MKDTLFIDDSSNVTLSQCQAKMRRMAQMGAKIIGIDYLQLMDAPGDSGSEKMTNISRGIKALTKELNIPVIAISSLTKEGTKGDRPPRMSDLFNSQGFQFDATQAWLLFCKDQKKDLREVNCEVGKSKDGAQGDLKFHFFAPAFKFMEFCKIDPADIPKDKPKVKSPVREDDDE